MEQDLDALVRRVDEDRWLASRFAPEDARRRLVVLYALNYEIAHAVESVRTPALGDIRLAWWREALGEIHEGGPARSHPVLQRYALALQQTPFPLHRVEALIAARARDLEPAPFASAAQREAYLDATAGNVMRLALAACGANAGAYEDLIREAALAWGGAGLLRAEPAWRARGRRMLAAEGETLMALSDRARAAHNALRAMGKPPAHIFPALGYVTLAPAYLKALERDRRDAPLLMRQAKLIAAAATGRL